MIADDASLRSFRRSSADLLRLAAPIAAGQIAVIGMTVTDIYMVGQVSTDALAAVQLGGSLWSIAVFIILGIMTGNSPIIGHLYGAAQNQQVRHQFQQVLWISLPLGLLASATVGAGIWLLPRLDITSEVAAQTQAYLTPFLLTAVMLSTFFALRTTFEGLGDPRPVMVFNFIAFSLNIPLNYLFIHGGLGVPALGGPGAGWGTLVVMVFLFTAMLAYAKFSAKLRYLALYRDFAAPCWATIRDTLKLGIPIALYITVEYSFFSLIPLFIAHLGAAVVGAHAIALNVDSLAFMVPLGLSHALSIKVAHALGAGQPKRARQIAITGFKLVWMLAATISLAKLALHEEIPRWFSDDRATQAIAANLFLFAALLGAIDCLQIAASGALRGYKDTRIPLLMQIIAFWVIAFPISYTLGLTDLWGGAIGVYGFWVGMIVAVVIASVLLLSRWNLLSKRFIASAQ